MPAAVVKSFAKKTGKSIDQVEKIWNAIRDSLISSGHKETDDNFYAMLVGGLKKALKLKESNEMLTYKQFMEKIKKVVRGGKVVKKVDCPPGKKAKDGKCVVMTGQEKMAKKKAAKKAAKTKKGKSQAGAIKKRKLSMKKSKKL